MVAAPKWQERKAVLPYVSPSAAGSYVGGGVGGCGERVDKRGGEALAMGLGWLLRAKTRCQKEDRCGGGCGRGGGCRLAGVSPAAAAAAAAASRVSERWNQRTETRRCSADPVDKHAGRWVGWGGGQLPPSAPKSDVLSDSPRRCNVVAPPRAKSRAHTPGSVRHTRAHQGLSWIYP